MASTYSAKPISNPSNQTISNPAHVLNFLRIALLIMGLTTFAKAQGHSGIPEIDTLPLNDWQAATDTLSYRKAMGLSALLPGGGQFYGNHPVRGGFLVGLETLLAGLAIYSNLVDIPHWQSQAREALDSADALFLMENRDPTQAESLEKRRRDKVAFARQRTQLASQQEDLTRSQYAWALGLHLYGVMDAMEIAYLSRHKDIETRSVRGAMYRGMAFPGGGQLYNHRYGKFGMLWMTLGASAVSAYSRQGMVELLNERLKIARQEAGGATSDLVTQLDKDRTLYRKRRNQYFWGMGIFYVYAILDGMVDASLSDFDAPAHFVFGPLPSQTGTSLALACQWQMPFHAP